MIKHTQKAVLKGRYAGTDQASGVSCPNFTKLAFAFDLPSFQVRSWADFDRDLPKFLAVDGPAICEVFMHPEQFFHPKLGVFVRPDGALVSPPLEDLSPFIDRRQLQENLRVEVHAKSLGITI
jgi:acetolactate synthase-1/2/3 large subunit